MNSEDKGLLGDFSDANEIGEGALACGGSPWLKELTDMAQRFLHLFKGGKFEEADNLLRAVDIQKEDQGILIGYLTATFQARESLPYRKEFYRLVLEKYRGMPGWDCKLIRYIE